MRWGGSLFRGRAMDVDYVQSARLAAREYAQEMASWGRVIRSKAFARQIAAQLLPDTAEGRRDLEALAYETARQRWFEIRREGR